MSVSGFIELGVKCGFEIRHFPVEKGDEACRSVLVVKGVGENGLKESSRAQSFSFVILEKPC